MTLWRFLSAVSALAACACVCGCVVNPVPTPGTTGGSGGSIDPTQSSDVAAQDSGVGRRTDTSNPTDDLDAGGATGESDAGSSSSGGPMDTGVADTGVAADSGPGDSSSADSGAGGSGPGDSGIADSGGQPDAAGGGSNKNDGGSSKNDGGASAKDGGAADSGSGADSGTAADGGSSNADAGVVADAGGGQVSGPAAACAAAKKAKCLLGVALICHPQVANWTGGPCAKAAKSAVDCLAAGKSCANCQNALKALKTCAWKGTVCNQGAGGGGGGGGSGGGANQMCMAFKKCSTDQLQVQCNNSGCVCTLGATKLLEFPPATNMCKASNDLLNGPCHKAATTVPAAICATNSDCLLTEVCVVAACGAKGTCAPRGDCAASPVKKACGCDGKTQPNACKAMWVQGVAIKSPGACP